MTDRTGGKRPDYTELNKGNRVTIQTDRSQQSSSTNSSSVTPEVSSHQSSSSLADKSTGETEGKLEESNSLLTVSSSDSEVELDDPTLSAVLSDESIVTEAESTNHTPSSSPDTPTETETFDASDLAEVTLQLTHLTLDSTEEIFETPNESDIDTDTDTDLDTNSQAVPTVVVDENIVVSEHPDIDIPVQLTEDVDDVVDPIQLKMAEQDELKTQIESLVDDIDDFLSENPCVDFKNSIFDLDSAIKNIEDLRSTFRCKHKQLEKTYADNTEYVNEYGVAYQNKIDELKNYILNAKTYRKDLRSNEDKAKLAENNVKERKLIFLNNEVKLAMDRLEKIFGTSLSDEKEEEVTRRKNDLPERRKETERILKSIQDIVGAGEEVETVKAIQARYTDLLTALESYTELVHTEFSSREVEKQKTFKKSLLNIHIPKFKGYESKYDVYTFQDQFEKLHLRDTPKNHLPDLLKNNYLEDPARMLVSDVYEIEEIWSRLKEAYGDHQIMLTKKLSQIEASRRSKSNVQEVLSAIINTMRDLMKLAKRHSIENKLYYGEGLNRIYRQMDVGMRRRWLERSTSDSSTEGESLWTNLITFLEKELKVHQQDAIIMNKSAASKSDDEQKPNRRRDSSFYTDGNLPNKPPAPKSDDQCHICGERDHVQTNGPGGSKLVQYFSCKIFAEWSNVERFKFLKSQGFCVQCLFPGADQKSGKHKEGHCQRDFVCKHSDHAKYSVKKHILVCDEHKHSNDNKETLKRYKERCIVRAKNLPEHAKNIQLSHYVMSPTKVFRPGSPLKVDQQPASSNFPISQPKIVQSTSPAAVSEVSNVTDHLADQKIPQASSPSSSFRAASEPVALETNQSESNSIISSAETECATSASNIETEETPQEITNKSDHQSYPARINQERINQEIPADEALKDENAVYILQTIKINHEQYTIFYDGGCKQFVCQFDAINRIGQRAVIEVQGPTDLGGVGGIKLESPHGIYRVALPLGNGEEAVLTGACLDKITETFPSYPLQGEVEKDIRVAYNNNGGNVRKLPDLPASVGGDISFMFGILYNRYFPTEIFRLPSGLSIFRSRFKNPDGSYGVVGGSHRRFREIEEQHNIATTSFLTTQIQLFRCGYQVNPDIRLLGFTEFDAYFDADQVTEDDAEILTHHFDKVENAGTEINARCPNCKTYYTPLKSFKDAESAGSEINYRCVRCRACKDCKNHERNEALSLKEEVEDDLINKSVTVDIVARETSAVLPFIADPRIKLAPNRVKAEKTYQRQLKVLQAPEDKASIIKAEAALQEMGFVDWVKNLPEDVQKSLREHEIQNFLPWRVAWKDSVTSPCRPVFDASQPTPSGYSLNDTVAKGKNNLNVLLEIFLRWRTHHVAFHNDVTKMYNKVKLQQQHWCFQRYLFQKDLDPSQPAEEKVVKTIIYGVKSSTNQAQRGLRGTAELSQEEYPKASEVIHKDTYMDDSFSGDETIRKAEKCMDDLVVVCGRGGFTLKGFTVSGKDPDPSLTKDGVSISVAGHTWFSKVDFFSLNIADLNFARKCRGRKTSTIKDVPPNLTRRQCASKAGEFHDLSGMFTPVIASIKLDLHELITRKLQWDDVIPDVLRPIWCSHFEMMEEVKNVRFQRAVIPEDAISLDAETLDFGDASKVLVCVAIYVRYNLKNGERSCQLLFARSRLVPDGMTQPRAELYAALVNAHSGEVVRRSLVKTHKKAVKFTDSQIVLYWITNIEKSLELWVRNRIIEIQRFTSVDMWRYVRSQDMIADIGTRRVTSLECVQEGSVWLNGFQWMRGEESEFPMQSAEEITLSTQELQVESSRSTADSVHVIQPVSEETTSQDEHLDSEKIKQRYLFSNYIIDPNYRRFKTVIRITAICIMYIRSLHHRIKLKTKPPLPPFEKPITLIIPEDVIDAAKSYFFMKATLEVKMFVKPKRYNKIAQTSNEMLTYTGRILPTDSVSIVGNATEVMKDLSSSTFNVPLVDRHSPLAISIVNEIHWYHHTAQHCGRDTVWRYVLQICYIFEGRSLVEMIGNSCERCRYLNKRTLEVIMGAITGYNLTIAPAFYTSQVDLAGPFSAYSPHNKRSTIKIWFVVIVCATTSSTNIKVMEDYTTTSFINAFTRFSCEVGYPKTLLVDQGSQIVKGCETMKFKFWDIKFRLHKDVSVDFEVCPVGGHNFNGKVERKIREIKKSINKAVSNERLALLQWETLGATIANTINNMPLALGSPVNASSEFIDLLTPNRLKLGRNNERSPVGAMTTTDYDKVIENNEAIFNAWFEVWLSAHVPTLMNQPKWFRSDKDLKVGDVVLFLKKDSTIESNYQFGIVESISEGRDGKVREVKVRYRNHGEDTNRTTDRAARGLVVIRRADEMNVMKEIGDISRYVEHQRKICDIATVGECKV